MYTLYPFGKLNVKTAILVPMLMLSMFTFIPLVQSQVMPNIAKITPAVFEQMSSAGESVNVIIQTLSSDYSAVVSQINDFGGKIGHMFKYVNALSASVPKSQIVELSANSHVEKIFYDAPRKLTVDRGANLDLMRGITEVSEADGVEAIELTPEMLEGTSPENAWNSYSMGARPIWATTNFGAGSLVAIIDTGAYTRNVILSYTSFLGGVDVSADVGTAYEGWNKSTNYFHGNHVAGIVAANVALGIPPTSGLYRYVLAIERYAGITFPVVGGRKVMPVPGMAPFASLYVIKVFDHTGGAASSSYIMAGMEWAVDLKANQGVDVDVVNMSYGGADLFDGRDPEDQLVDLMTSVGITPCASAGNEGPASMTAGSRPGGANTAIASGAADHPVQTRAFYDYVYNYPGIGYYLYVSNNVQIDSMTSRGPTADGRVKPDITATGVYVFSAYTGAGGVAWASGTSMASPATAGAVALLNAWAETGGVPASPEDYKQAIMGGAVWLPGWTQYDQGAGYLNAANSLGVLMTDTSYGDVATPLPSPPPLTDISNIPIVGSGTYTTTFSGLAPGWNKEFIFTALPTTNFIRVEISNVNLGVDPVGMNALTVHIQSAKRTRNGYYVHYSWVLGDAWYQVTDGATRYKGAVIGGLGDFDYYTRLTKIEPGYVKVVVENDWMSYDLASATITIKVTEEPLPTPDLYLSGTINDGQNIGWLAVPITGTPTKVELLLWWDHSWAMYPTNDLDLIVYWDDGYNYDGATLNSPERVKLDRPTYIYVLIMGYSVYTGTDNFTLKIYFDY